MYLYIYIYSHLIHIEPIQGETSAEHRGLQRRHGLMWLFVAPRIFTADGSARSGAPAGFQTLGDPRWLVSQPI